MYPGSGPSDRDNDVFFPSIRGHLLEAGIAVSSFDKRGVGGSTGRWQEAAIVEQASDCICCLDRLQAEVGGRIGLFGHSQGGWVVIEAAAHFPEVAFAVSSSGPGGTPEQQERYATPLRMKRAGISDEGIEEVCRFYDDLVAMMRAGTSLDDARRKVAEGGYSETLGQLGTSVLPDDEAEWRLDAALIDYDPRPALERIRVPILAVFGADDPITPVDDSIAVFREAVRPDLLQVTTFAGAGHRFEAGDPPSLVEGYLETLTTFILAA
jgi:pimeloyl-ACP methyl ester carboxylesterase